MADETLDGVVDLLDRHHQRATYGAVAAVVDRPPRHLMGGRPRDTRHSWIVNRETGLPTGYGPEDMHPELLANSTVLTTGRELEAWMRERRGAALLTGEVAASAKAAAESAAG